MRVVLNGKLRKKDWRMMVRTNHKPSDFFLFDLTVRT